MCQHRAARQINQSHCAGCNEKQLRKFCSRWSTLYSWSLKAAADFVHSTWTKASVRAALWFKICQSPHPCRQRRDKRKHDSELTLWWFGMTIWTPCMLKEWFIRLGWSCRCWDHLVQRFGLSFWFSWRWFRNRTGKVNENVNVSSYPSRRLCSLLRRPRLRTEASAWRSAAATGPSVPHKPWPGPEAWCPLPFPPWRTPSHLQRDRNIIRSVTCAGWSTPQLLMFSFCWIHFYLMLQLHKV